MNLNFWIDEVERLYREGMSLQRAIFLVQLMKMNYNFERDA
jgi:hypothetical protein